MQRTYAPQLPGALEVHPTEEEFADPMRYIQLLHQRHGKEHGIVKIVPPKDWNPKLGISFDEFAFTTCEQQIDQLNHRDGSNAKFIRKLRCFFQDKGREFGSLSVLSGLNTDLYQLYKKVQEMGGYENVCKQNMWGLIAKHLGYDSTHEIALITKDIYKSVLLDFDRAIASGKRIGDTIDQTFVRSRKRQNTNSKMGGMGATGPSLDQSGNVDKGAFGFEEGTEYTMTEFKKKVDQYNIVVCRRKGLESLAEVEEYYWKVVTTGEENLTVEYGNDLDVGTYSSAFPKPDDEFGRHPWNLNQLPRESGSLLRNMTYDVDGVSRPWLYVGMAFSSFCWHNEDNYLYSINYMHAGNTKVWYGVPGIAASQFEHVFADKVPELFNSDRNLLYRLTTMINPSTFVSAGVKVTRALHTPGTFIVTFPQAYHAGFSIGWNIAEAVNFATIDWLKWGRQSELVYMSARRQSVVSVDHLSMCAIAELMTAEGGELKGQPGLKRDLSFMFSREAHLRQHVSQKGITLSCDLLSKKVSSKNFPAPSRTLDEFAIRANSFHGNDHNLPMCCICRQWMFTSFIVCSGSCGQQKQLFYCCAHFDKACCSCSMESRILVHRMPLSLLYALNVIVAGEQDARVLPTCGGDELFTHIKELPKGVSKFIKFAPDSVQKPSSGPTTPQSSREDAAMCEDRGGSGDVLDDAACKCAHDKGGGGSSSSSSSKGLSGCGSVHLSALGAAQGTADMPFVIDDDDDDNGGGGGGGINDDDNYDAKALDLHTAAVPYQSAAPTGL